MGASSSVEGSNADLVDNEENQLTSAEVKAGRGIGRIWKDIDDDADVYFACDEDDDDDEEEDPKIDDNKWKSNENISILTVQDENDSSESDVETAGCFDDMHDEEEEREENVVVEDDGRFEEHDNDQRDDDDDEEENSEVDDNEWKFSADNENVLTVQDENDSSESDVETAGCFADVPDEEEEWKENVVVEDGGRFEEYDEDQREDDNKVLDNDLKLDVDTEDSDDVCFNQDLSSSSQELDSDTIAWFFPVDDKNDEKEVTNGSISANHWECEHCTFVNLKIDNVCQICCKTRSNVLRHLEQNSTDEDLEAPSLLDSQSVCNEDDDNDTNLQEVEDQIAFSLIRGGRLKSLPAAKIAAKLMMEKYDEELSIAVAEECDQISTARAYMQKITSLISRNKYNKVIYHSLCTRSLFSSKRKAILVLELLDMGIQEERAILAAQHSNTPFEAMEYLQYENELSLLSEDVSLEEAVAIQASLENREILMCECAICLKCVSPSGMFAMYSCEHTFCIRCAKAHFTERIRDHIGLLLVHCPICGFPNSAATQDMNYFNFLENQLRPILDEDIMKVFQNKILELGVQNMAHFKWCRRCDNGFIVEPQDRNVRCDKCQYEFCVTCEREWLPQHVDFSCEEFAKWYETSKMEAPPDFINKLLNERGIDCPKCKVKFELAKGGCMHLTCQQCTFQFCSGCRNEFHHGRSCGFADDCSTKGLHAHHSRNCLYHLRDKPPEDLINLLEENKIEYKIANSCNQQSITCQVEMQKEISEGNSTKLVDTICGENVDVKSGILCRTHFVEYLVGLINRHSLDPAKIFDLEELKAELLRNKKLVPKSVTEETNYRQFLIQVVVQELPLTNT